MTSTWTEAFPPLTIALLPNGNLRLEDPTENSEGFTAVVDVHPMQLRLMAERLGMLREVAASDAALLKSEREHAQRQRAEIDSLKRRLLFIRDRGLRLQENFRKYADWQHADLSDEMSQINGVVALLDMAVDDFEHDYSFADRAQPPEPEQDDLPGSVSPDAPAAEQAGSAQVLAGEPHAGGLQRDLLEAAS